MWINKFLENKQKILALSPMADMTDSAFCRVVRNIGGADIVFREMVSSEALIRDSEKTLKMTDFHEEERPIVQQIFGADPQKMAQAARIILDRNSPEGIDINMGCPVQKLTSQFNGSALMKDPELAGKIVRAVKKEIGDVPLSVKIRLGWSDPDDFKTFIPVLEKAGADLITIHGRTRVQGYSGTSDWERIRQAKELATVPVLANGDIHEPHQVAEALEQTGCDGVMIARGALGNPWFFKQALDPEFRVSLEERIKIILDHAKLHIEEYGEKALVTFRKHLAWYFKINKLGFELEGIKQFRARLVRVSTIDELADILNELLDR